MFQRNIHIQTYIYIHTYTYIYIYITNIFYVCYVRNAPECTNQYFENEEVHSYN